MCRFKSGIILKDRVFIPDYDSHTDMLEELKIADTEDNAERLLVRAELVPPDDDVFSPVSSWKYHVDQDILPDWYVTEVDEMRMREAVTTWAKEHIHIGEKIERIDSGTHWIKDCEAGEIGGTAEIRVLANSDVTYIGGHVKIQSIVDSYVKYISGQVDIENVDGFSYIKNITGLVNIEYINDRANIAYIRGQGVCIISTWRKWINNYNVKNICIKEKAVLIDMRNGKIYHAGEYKTVIMGGKENDKF